MKYRGSTSGALTSERAVVPSQRRAAEVGGEADEADTVSSGLTSGFVSVVEAVLGFPGFVA